MCARALRWVGGLAVGYGTVRRGDEGRTPLRRPSLPEAHGGGYDDSGQCRVVSPGSAAAPPVPTRHGELIRIRHRHRPAAVPGRSTVVRSDIMVVARQSSAAPYSRPSVSLCRAFRPACCYSCGFLDFRFPRTYLYISYY